MSTLQVATAFIDKKAVPKSHIAIFTATKDEHRCTFDGMKKSFMEVARATGEDGLFIFQFSGHGLTIEKRSEGQFGLVPADFDDSASTFITGSILNQWLIDSNCKARVVLFILDCCYAGGLGDDLTAGVPNLRSGLYVLSASTALEASLVVLPLGNSLFTYFLAYAIRKFRFVPGSLPISKIFEECQELCVAVSSLMISYHGPHLGLLFDKFKPQLQYFDVSAGKELEDRVSAWLEESLAEPSAVAPGASHEPTLMFSKFSFVLKYYKVQKRQLWKRAKVKSDLSEICRSWLLFASGSRSPLKELSDRGLLSDEVLCAAVCLMMWSVASIQIASNETKSVIDPNMFLVGFVYAAAALDSFQSSPITVKELEEAWGFYQAVVERHDLNDAELQKVHGKIEEDSKATLEHHARIDEEGGLSLSPLEEEVGLSLSTLEGNEILTPTAQLEPILEESVVSSNGEISEPPSIVADSSAIPTSPEPTEWTVQIPELAALSPRGAGTRQPESRSIVPSLKRNSVLRTLRQKCRIPSELLDNHAVVADSLVLQSLQVSCQQLPFVREKASWVDDAT